MQIYYIALDFRRVWWYIIFGGFWGKTAPLKNVLNVKGERFAAYANREFTLDKYKISKNTCVLPSAEELKAALQNSGAEARANLTALFDADTFVELGAFTKRKFCEYQGLEHDEELEGVICGYGAIDGRLVYAFAQDSTRMKGALDENHAKKICALYELALKNGAPVVGIFDCAGADIFEGTAALAAYSRIMKAVSAASGVIPQVALITGNCIGSFATIAAMFDFIIKTKSANFYVTAPAFVGTKESQAPVTAFAADDRSMALMYARNLLNYLPSKVGEGVSIEATADNLNRMLGNRDFGGDVNAAIAAIADNGIFFETASDYAPVLTTAFATVGGVKCGFIGTSFVIDEGRITAAAARKAARFVDFCDAFSIPLITLVDSMGLAICDENENAPFSADLAKLALAYAKSTTPKVTVILGHAIGASFALLGSKALGADVAYALDDAEIGALSSEAAVAFAWNNMITPEKSRDDLIAEWRKSLASPVAAASLGEIDDIVSANELRARICSALMMLAAKGTVRPRLHTVNPL